MALSDTIKRIIEEEGIEYTERQRTIHTTCPMCGRNDKLSILKENGATICYRGSCQFKGFFTDWLVHMAGIPYAAAKERIYENPNQSKRLHESLHLTFERPDPIKSSSSTLPIPCVWPGPFVPISSAEARDGWHYISSRGIEPQVAEHYQIHYAPSMRRIVTPIFMNGVCYGWQARAIDPVDAADRMRNNVGFSRDSLLMFADDLKDRSYAIIAEGPFDAMKFYKVGGAVATMGKVVTQKQLQIIKDRNVQMVFLALDDDAIPEMRDLSTKLNLETYRILVPQSCVERCAKTNRKADFGECTMDECIEAVKHAVKIDDLYLMTYWGSIQDVRKIALRRENNEK